MRQETREKNNLINRLAARFSGWMRRLWNKVAGPRHQATTQNVVPSDTTPLLSEVINAPTAPEQSAPHTQKASSIGLFSLPDDLVIHQLLPRLQLQVQVLTKEPTPEQKDQILAFDAYHLIVDDSASKKYRIGFCKKSFWGKEGYVTQPLDEKSALFRLVTENPEYFKEGMSPNPLVLSYLEQAIDTAGGLKRPVGYTVNRLAQLCKSSFIRMRTPLYKEIVMQEALDKLLHHVAYGEEKEAEAILIGRGGELLLSKYQGSVLDCSRVRTFLNTTAFQLAIRNGDWSMYHMMLKYVPQNQRADLQQQFEVLEREGLSYTLDNLNFCGLRVLETDPSEDQEKDVIARNAYHLILERDGEGRITNCSIGFYDAQSKKYVRRLVSDDIEGLKQFVRDETNAPLFRREAGLAHLVTRDKALLDVARTEINKEMNGVRGKTEETKSTTLKADIELLQATLADYVRRYGAMSPAERTETWCVLVGWAQRLLPANAWQWWMSRDIDWWNISAKDFQRARPGTPITCVGVSWLPLSSSLGVNCGVPGGAGGRGWIGLPTWAFLNSFCQVVSENYQTLSSNLLDLRVRP